MSLLQVIFIRKSYKHALPFHQIITLVYFARLVRVANS